MAKYYGTGHIQEIIKIINKLSYRHSLHKVFEHFLEISAIAFANAVDLNQKETREKRYLEIVSGYTKDELTLYAQMFSLLIDALEEHVPHPSDVLGQIFHRLELHNQYKGQFFTPQHICDFMGSITGVSIAEIKQKGYITVCEPTCGSGSMILGLAKAMQKDGLNYCTDMLVTATDIDLKCVHMTYLQLSLYGIPAIVIHGNSLTLEQWSYWYTPVYILNGWAFKKPNNNSKNETALAGEPTSYQESTKYDIELTADKNGQLRFI